MFCGESLKIPSKRQTLTRGAIVQRGLFSDVVFDALIESGDLVLKQDYDPAVHLGSNERVKREQAAAAEAKAEKASSFKVEEPAEEGAPFFLEK